MQFLVIAHDYKEGLKKRLAVREEHIKLGDKMVAAGKHLYGVAILDDKGQMRGSAIVVDFPSRKELDDWLKIEPYVTGKVWEKIEITPCKLGPSYIKK